MDGVLGGGAHVGGEAHLAVVGAAKSSTEVGVQVSEKLVLVGVDCSRSQGVGNDGCGTSAIKEVDRCRHTTTVGALQGSTEVGSQVDMFAVVHARSEDTRNVDDRAWKAWVCRARTGKVANTSRVDEKSQKGVLVCGSVVLKQCYRVFVTGKRCQKDSGT